MYTAFYGLGEKPFSLTPNPRYLYLSESHREALAHLLYGIEQGEGFIAITGEVGTGKTTICRTLIERLGVETEVAFLFNPSGSALELLEAIAREFGLDDVGPSRSDIHDALNRYLLNKKREGKRVLLIIDESQNLSAETLEQVRLVSNLETSTAKLIQILLLGQPELDRKLDSSELRQLRQRITVRWKLAPLSRSECGDYVAHRLMVAAGARREIFTATALREIYRRTRGIPRLINVVCDRALLAGYAAQIHKIDAKVIKRVAREIPDAGRKLEPKPSRRAPAIGWGSGVIITLLAAMAGVGTALTFFDDEFRVARLTALLWGAGEIATPSVSTPPPVRAAFPTGSEAGVSQPLIARTPAIDRDEGSVVDSAAMFQEIDPSTVHGDSEAVPPPIPAGLETVTPAELESGNQTVEGSLVRNVASLPAVTSAADRSESISAATAVSGPESDLELGSTLAVESDPTLPLPEPSFLGWTLTRRDPSSVRTSAVDSILKGYGLPTLDSALRSSDEALQELRRRGLQVLVLEETDLEQLRILNHPALLPLVADDGRYRLVALRDLQDDLALLEGLQESEELRVHWLEVQAQWQGKAYVLWRQFESAPEVISFGDQGLPVLWLQRSLVELGHSTEEPSGSFGQMTLNGVRSLQRRQRLKPDGAAGPRTQMVIYDLLERYRFPRLSDRGTSG